MAYEQMTREKFTDLYQRWRSQQLTEAEWLLFKQAATDPSMRNLLSEAVKQDLEVPEFDNLLSAGETQAAYQLLMEKVQASRSDNDTPVHRVHFLRTAWFKYAAAVIITLCAAGYLWINHKNEKDLTKTVQDKPLQTDVAPGGDKAVLTLADGTQIVLDSAANGNLAQQGGARIVKLPGGQISYVSSGQPGIDVMLNTVSTPSGGQYRIILPDGTKVWLNAASSITYPTVFADGERPVKISGEVYFEVTKDKQKPFRVDVAGKSSVEVLGTSFNINSYADEKSIKTTLLEGSVRVFNKVKSGKAPARSVVLKPGQQAAIAPAPDSGGQNEVPTEISVSSNVDMEQTLAWKNGIFNFNGADLFAVMRQLERWYDIKIQYRGSVSNVIFEGEMYRDANLSDVLQALQKMGVNFSLTGKVLTVSE